MKPQLKGMIIQQTMGTSCNISPKAKCLIVIYIIHLTDLFRVCFALFTIALKLAKTVSAWIKISNGAPWADKD